MTKALVVLSGGQDSTTCLFHAKREHSEVRAICIDYGQRHRREVEAACTVGQLAHVDVEVVHVPGILVSASPLTNQMVELEQYKNWDALPGGLEKTFVPMRNTFFLTLAANRALAWGCTRIVTGVSQEDYGGYPDCRAEFIEKLEDAFTASLENEVFDIQTPLIKLTKAKTVELALRLPGCYPALAYSHTAYDGAYPPTGHDHATLLRAKGFAMRGVPDPLIVRAYWEQALDKLPDEELYHKFGGMIDSHRPGYASVEGVVRGLMAMQANF